MNKYKKAFVYFMVLGIFLLTLGMRAFADVPIYVAVQDAGGSGIWRLEDRNGDNDALDTGENILFSNAHDYNDVAVDEKGVVYAIEETTGAVYRLEDLNDDGDAMDAGEDLVFRDINADGLKLKSPMSIAVVNHFDLDTLTTRAHVYVMDLKRQLVVRLADLDDDHDAQGAGEICEIHETVAASPFTAVSMSVDETGGRIIGTLPGRRMVVRLADINDDCYVDSPVYERCPAPGCGSGDFNEYKIIKRNISGAMDLNNPYGVAVSGKGEYFVSQRTSARVVKLTDLNGDDDALDPGETRLFYESARTDAFDLVLDDKDIVYVAEETSPGTYDITRLEDRNLDGDAADSGESSVYASFSLNNYPVGLAALLPPSSPMDIKPHLVDVSPLKGPLLVVEDGTTVPLKLQVLDRSSGLPVPGVKVGSSVLNGCFDLCPQKETTDADGVIIFDVTRTYPSPDGGEEALTFFVFGDEETIPIVPIPCAPGPGAVPGPDQDVYVSEAVTLDGSMSIGPGLLYCWEQTGGTDLGLKECTKETFYNPSVSFTAPPSPGTLTFDLTVRNACDMMSTTAAAVEVYEEFRLNLLASYAAEQVILDFQLGASAPSVWVTYLILPSPISQVIPLWVYPLPAIHPPIDFTIPLPLSGMGWVGIWSGLISGSGLEASDLKWVNTGL